MTRGRAGCVCASCWLICLCNCCMLRSRCCRCELQCRMSKGGGGNPGLAPVIGGMATTGRAGRSRDCWVCWVCCCSLLEKFVMDKLAGLGCVCVSIKSSLKLGCRRGAQGDTKPRGPPSSPHPSAQRKTREGSPEVAAASRPRLAPTREPMSIPARKPDVVPPLASVLQQLKRAVRPVRRGIPPLGAKHTEQALSPGPFSKVHLEQFHVPSTEAGISTLGFLNKRSHIMHRTSP